jgi:hypothetical protein
LRLIDARHHGPLLSAFAVITVNEVVRSIDQVNAVQVVTARSRSDITAQCLYSETLGHTIAQFANLSFRHAVFPVKFKMASVTPLLKKHGFDASNSSNYCPISNFNTVSYSVASTPPRFEKWGTTFMASMKRDSVKIIIRGQNKIAAIL